MRTATLSKHNQTNSYLPAVVAIGRAGCALGVHRDDKEIRGGCCCCREVLVHREVGSVLMCRFIFEFSIFETPKFFDKTRKKENSCLILIKKIKKTKREGVVVIVHRNS